MAERRPLVIKDGLVQEIPSGDTIPAGVGGGSGLQNNLVATAAPAVTNDDVEGYAVGSRWVDVTNDNTYTCVDATTGAAVWVQENGAGGGASAFLGLSDTPGSFGTPGQATIVNPAGDGLIFGDVSAGGGGGGTSARPFQGFRAVRTTSTQALTALANTTIIFNDELFDTENGYDPTTGIFTVPASLDGKYMVFTAFVNFDAAEDAAITIRKGATAADTLALNQSVSTSSINATSGAYLVSTGDTIYVDIYLSTSGNVFGNANCAFSGHVVSGPVALSAAAYDFRLTFASAPTTSEVLERVVVPRSITFPANLEGSVGQVGTNPTATFDIDVQDDGVSIGTISVSTGGVFTFTTTSGTAKQVAAGSEVEFIAPASVDATIADLDVGVLAETLGGLVAQPARSEDITGTAYTFVAADAGKWKHTTNASAVTLTIDAGVFQVDDEVMISQDGAGLVSFSPDTGITINSRGSLTDSAGQWAVAGFKVLSSTEVLLFGDLA